ncbi:MAG: tail-specific protease [Desulfobulbus propionicus]|nr:MAG: tail-specific protease [Desulfobulbus propionicus]
MRRFFYNLLFILCVLLAQTGWSKVFPSEFNAGRNQLIAYILSHQLPARHFSHEPFDDTLSKVAFDLYIRQLDPRKRFLLQSDVDQLQAFAEHIDDELKRGRIILADAGAELLNDRIRLVKGFLDTLLDQKIDINKDEYLEADPEKITFPKTSRDLQERWRKIIKMMVLDTYFEQFEQELEKTNQKEDTPIPFPTEDQLEKAVEKVRTRTRRSMDRLLSQTRQDHYNRFFDAVARSFDPHTNYMPPTSKEDFNIHMSGSLEGIGAMLREEDGLIKVVRIMPGSGAERQGELAAEDTILTVREKDGDAVEISDMRIREAVSYIRGPKGTEVILGVQKPDGSKKTISIMRDVVRLEETYVKSTVLATESNNKIGYLRIPSFYRDFAAAANDKKGRNVTDDTRSELQKLKEQDVVGIILDLRNNGGGALGDAVNISGLFLPGGPVVQVKNSQGVISVLQDEDPTTIYDGPLIILVNQFSASASEILAAALQDYGRALIIGGSHTHGKGTVQAVLDMNSNLPLLQMKRYDDLGALKLTVQKFYRINGDSTQSKGVTPDLVVPSLLDYLESGEQFMDNPLPWDKVEDVGYDRWQGPHFDVQTVRQEGMQWVVNSPQFQEIRREVDQAKERKEQTQVTISFQAMRKEREELEKNRQQAMQAGLLAGTEADDDREGDIPLSEEIKNDPFVQISLFLQGTKSLTQASVSEAH